MDDSSENEAAVRKPTKDGYCLITKMGPKEANKYFRETKQYVNFDLPPYIDLSPIIVIAAAIMLKKSLSDVCKKDKNGKPRYPGDYSNVNYTLLSNKDGGFAWRPLQIINPVLYVDLVNTITEPKAWKTIGKLFENRSKTSIDCISIPLRSKNEESNRAVQVSRWWDRIEQESLRKALDFKFMFQTDITNCYGSIYTHSLEWAIEPGGRKKIKMDRASGKKTKNLGTEIDFRLRQMNQNQTIGIPQGSTLMDFIAEIVLAGTDLELDELIRAEIDNDKAFSIVRYRDDYRIFADEYQVGHKIMKMLNNVLSNWNLAMNVGKTNETDDIITSSIKKEKVEEIYVGAIPQSLQKTAMRIYGLSKKYPNSGLIAKKLTEYYDRVQNLKYTARIDYEVTISIIAMIAYYSPRYIAQVAAIITVFIERANNELDRKKIVEKIVKRFSDIPNTELIDVWLQRITDVDNIKDYEFSSSITKVSVNKESNSSLWNLQWLPKKYHDIINGTEISTLPHDIDRGTFNPTITREEFELYRAGYPD